MRPALPSDEAWIREVIVREWAGPLIERTDEFIDATTLPAMVAQSGGERVGLMTLLTHDDHLEVFTLNSFAEGMGVGSALLEAADAEALRLGVGEVRLFTVNHNLRALRFYQRRGYRMWAVHRDTITRARAVKPMIPLVSDDGIPICDEIELRKTVTS